jgi:hypothetical protein
MLLEHDACALFSPCLDWAGRLRLADCERSNKIDRTQFGGMSRVSILLMKLICWNLYSPGHSDHDLISSIHADTTANK